MASTYRTIFERFNINAPDARGRATTWFEQQIKLLGKPKPSQVMRGGLAQNRGSAKIGNMYFFYYNAKLKDKLPQWDMCPLVIPFSINSDGFTGLNFHYLPYGTRIWLLDALLDVHNQKIESDTVLKITWAKISAVSKLAVAKDAVHRYLSPHVQSPLKIVYPNDWQTALMLPVEKFVSNTGKRIKAHKIWS